MWLVWMSEQVQISTNLAWIDAILQAWSKLLTAANGRAANFFHQNARRHPRMVSSLGAHLWREMSVTRQEKIRVEGEEVREEL